MIPKEKAENILNAMFTSVMYAVEDTKPYNTTIDNLMKLFPSAKESAKQCSIIAVDEIIRALHYADTAYDLVPSIEFYNEVKTELEKP